MLRVAGRLAPRFVRHSSSSVVAASETYQQKALRWADVLGSLTKWHSRKAWILDLDPLDRGMAFLLTEYERKLIIYSCWANMIMFPVCMWYWYGQFTHLATKPPCPIGDDSPIVNNRKSDFGWHGKFPPGYRPEQSLPRCAECRWLEFECKKQCQDRLKERGIEIWGLSKPRTQTMGFH